MNQPAKQAEHALLPETAENIPFDLFVQAEVSAMPVCW